MIFIILFLCHKDVSIEFCRKEVSVLQGESINLQLQTVVFGTLSHNVSVQINQPNGDTKDLKFDPLKQISPIIQLSTTHLQELPLQITVMLTTNDPLVELSENVAVSVNGEVS